MKGIIVVALIFGSILIVVYWPVIRSRYKLRKTKHIFEEQKILLSDLYADCLVLEESELGQGGSQNSGPRFKDVHKNQDFAINSVLYILNHIGG